MSNSGRKHNNVGLFQTDISFSHYFRDIKKGFVVGGLRNALTLKDPWNFFQDHSVGEEKKIIFFCDLTSKAEDFRVFVDSPILNFEVLFFKITARIEGGGMLLNLCKNDIKFTVLTGLYYRKFQ